MKKNILILFLIILLIGAGLRIYNLSTESLWCDEPYSIDNAKQDSLKDIINTVNYNEFYNPPLYYILLHHWIGLLGDDELALRLFSAIFGIASILMIFFVAKEIFNPEIGLISSLILSLSVLDILYSQEGRAYALFSLLVLISVYSFIKILRTEKPLYYPLYIISSLAMLYTLPLGILVIFFQNIFLIIFYERRPKITKQWILGQIIILLFYIPYIPYFLKMFKLNYLYFLFRIVDKYGAPAFLKNYILISAMLAIGFAVLIIFISYYKESIKLHIKNLKSKGSNPVFLVFFVIVGILYFFMTSILIEPVFLTRLTLFLMPFLYMVIAAGISKFKKPVKLIMILIIIILCMRTLSIYYLETTKEDWRGAVKYIEENSKDEDIILACSEDMPFRYYYPKANELINLKPYNNVSEIKDKLTNKSFWIVFSNHGDEKVCKDILLDKPYLISKTFKGVIIYYIEWT